MYIFVSIFCYTFNKSISIKYIVLSVWIGLSEIWDGKEGLVIFLVLYKKVEKKVRVFNENKNKNKNKKLDIYLNWCCYKIRYLGGDCKRNCFRGRLQAQLL